MPSQSNIKVGASPSTMPTLPYHSLTTPLSPADLMSNNEALNEEQEAITSIYDTEILSFTSLTKSNSTTTAILTLPNTAYSFTLSFPSTYPDEPPSITGTHHVSASAKIGEGDSATTILRDVLGHIYTPGQVCLFDLIEEATPLLVSHHASTQQDGATQDSEKATTRSEVRPESRGATLTEPSSASANTSSNFSIHMPPPPWTTSDPLVVNKSTFIARCVAVSSLSDATQSITHLLSTNKRVASATHNISAWRIKVPSTYTSTQPSKLTSTHDTPTEITIQDSDDDGETAAGGRLLHLMQLMDVWNVVVVVSRWYGGVKLGPDRFRCVNAVAREVLVRGGFGKGEGEKEGKEGGKGGVGKKRKR